MYNRFVISEVRVHLHLNAWSKLVFQPSVHDNNVVWFLTGHNRLWIRIMYALLALDNIFKLSLLSPHNNTLDSQSRFQDLNLSWISLTVG